jgi:hypothetical protein
MMLVSLAILVNITMLLAQALLGNWDLVAVHLLIILILLYVPEGK